MSSKYQIGDERYAHFVTFTVVHWIDLFTRDVYREVLMESLDYCIKNKGLVVHAFCIMSNHMHLVISANENAKLASIVRDFKKYTSYKLIDTLKNNSLESRREWMLWMFERAGRKNASNENFQLWQNGYHPIELSTPIMVKQKIDYIHENPVRAGFVREAEEYKYSSACYYSGKYKSKWTIEYL
jgi:REP element-mobilizing transposase RayT